MSSPSSRPVRRPPLAPARPPARQPRYGSRPHRPRARHSATTGAFPSRLRRCRGSSVHRTDRRGAPSGNRSPVAATRPRAPGGAGSGPHIRACRFGAASRIDTTRSASPSADLRPCRIVGPAVHRPSDRKPALGPVEPGGGTDRGRLWGRIGGGSPHEHASSAPRDGEVRLDCASCRPSMVDPAFGNTIRSGEAGAEPLQK